MVIVEVFNGKDTVRAIFAWFIVVITQRYIIITNNFPTSVEYDIPYLVFDILTAILFVRNQRAIFVISE
jgi:hypothetical protein